MSDRNSHIYDGLGATLVDTYTISNTSNSTSGMLCSEYSRLNVYLNVSAVSLSGIVKVSIEHSYDGDNWFKGYGDILTTHWDGSTVYISEYENIGTVQGYYMVFPNAGKYFRVVVTYISGTSLTIDSCTIEAKT